MKTGIALVLAVVAAATGFLAGATFSPGGDEAAATAPAAANAALAEVAALRAENRRLERAVAEAETRAREAEDSLLAGLASAPGAEAGAAATGADATAAGAGAPRFFGREFDGALSHVDWNLVGDSLHGLVRTLDRGRPFLERKEKIPPEIVSTIQRFQSPLLAAAIQVRDALPGGGVNGKFTSGPFAANAIASALAAAGLPLDDAQAERVAASARDLLARDAARLAGYGDDAYALEQFLDEVALKGRFYDEVFAVLTPEQAAALSPAEVRDRVRLDLFSPALLFGGRLETIPVKDETEVLSKVGGRVAKAIALTKEQVPAVEGIFRDWAAAIPRDLLYEEWNALDAQGMVTAPRATAWGRQLLALYRALAASESLTPQQRRTLHAVSNVLVPLA